MAAQTEGNTYVANWEKTARGYRAWLKRRSRQKVTAPNEDELREQLWEIAMEAYGDGEACIEFVPPLPTTKKSAAYFDPAWYQLNSNEGLHYFHSAPICRNDLQRHEDR